MKRQRWLQARNSFVISDFRLNAAGAGEAPAAQRFVDGEQAGGHKNQSKPQFEIHDDDAGDETKRADDAAGDASVAADVGLEEPAHGKNLARAGIKANSSLRCRDFAAIIGM